MEVWKKIKFNIITFFITAIVTTVILLFINYSYGYERDSKKIKVLYCEEVSGVNVCVLCIEGYKYVIVDKEKNMNWAGLGITQMFETMGMRDHISVPVSCR